MKQEQRGRQNATEQQAERAIWIKPTLRSLTAGSAEAGAGQVDDDIANQS